MGKVKLAIVGVGNCAASLVQGLWHYSYGDVRGLITPKIGPYSVADVEIVAAFDVARGKVGVPLGRAVKAFPNDTLQFSYVGLDDGPIVARGPTLDGLGPTLRTVVKEDSSEPVHVQAELRRTRATVVVNYLPVGSDVATNAYAQSAIEAGCAFVNCIPSFVASVPEKASRFAGAGLPVIGDDIKSQVGATIVHRSLVSLLRDRGVNLLRTYQLNVGGNSDFLNMLERSRLVSKKISKTQSVTSVMGVELPPDDVHVGPSDHVPWLGDRKVAMIRLEAEGFGGAPMTIDLRMEVWDSPNSAAVVLDAVRCAQVALDRGESGAILAPSAAYMKSPSTQLDDDEAAAAVERWLGDEGL